MSLRQLWWMGIGKKEFEGAGLEYLVRMIPVGVYAPGEIAKRADLNPFKERKPDSPLLAAHKQKLANLKLQMAAGGK